MPPLDKRYGIERGWPMAPGLRDYLGLAPSTGAAGTYLGQVATRARIPNSFTSSNKRMMCRSRHITRDAITSLQLGFCNWYVNTSTGGESLPGGTAAVTASVEYPVGTFTQVTFSATPTGNMADGATLLSDAVSVTIPNGAAFFVRSYFVGTIGIPYHSPGSVDSTNGEAATYNNVITDQTMSGTVAQSGGNFTMGPSLILAQTRRPSVFLLADSRGAGTGDTPNDATGDVGELARSIGPALAYINAGAPSDRAMWVAGGNAKRVALAAYCSHVVCELAINDISAGQTAAQILADHQTIYAAFNKPTFQTTIAPVVSTTSDGYATVAGQTPAGNNAIRTTLNNAIRALPARLVSYFEVADAVESSRDSGKWKAPGFTADGTHETALGYGAIRDSGVVNPAAFTL